MGDPLSEGSEATSPANTLVTPASAAIGAGTSGTVSVTVVSVGTVVGGVATAVSSH